jgi:regulator of protease activity HflC (stomatin/prohibitin superfamily)
MMKEKLIEGMSGAVGLLLGLGMFAAGVAAFVIAGQSSPSPLLMTIGFLGTLGGITWLCGLFTVEPGGAKALLLFGDYRGTVRSPGFHWANPFMSKKPISIRIRTLNGDRLKVNDQIGNPIEIAAVVTWQVDDTFEALFKIDDYEAYVAMQTETALRHSATMFPYDGADDVVTLRNNTVDVAEHLRIELQERLDITGITVLDARLSHLAYAAEIAQAMLRRQQAEAVIAARQKIVDGAVGMVEMALTRLEREGIITMDDERRAAMVSNLMVVLCSEQATTPIVNTGTLYS